MESDKAYDIVILGATGFTGQFVVEEVLREVSSSGKSHKICVAGRNKQKLQAGLEAAGKLCGVAVNSVQSEVVDVTDREGLLALASKTRVLLSCVGPYREHGQKVVQACVGGGADCLDISGEPQYLETVQAELADLASSKAVHVVGSCGFDSVPADLGVAFLYDNFPGELCHVEMIAGHGSSDGSSAGIHATTLECAVLGYANRDRLRDIRAKILTKDLSMPRHRPPKRGSLWYHSPSRQWCIANLASDRSVVIRSQHLLHKIEQRPPVNFSAYFGMHSLSAALKALLFGAVFVAMSAFECSRNLLIKYPEVFTLGMFSWAGPEREQLRKQTFSVVLAGTGWSKDTAAATSTDKRGPPDTVRYCRVRGPDPGYFGTALIVVQCALTMLEEKQSLPSGGGVFTPAAAFLHTSLLSRLQARGVTFSMATDAQL